MAVVLKDLKVKLFTDGTDKAQTREMAQLSLDPGLHVLVKQLLVNVPSFSREDVMPVVGRKYHMACIGVFRIEDGVGIVDSK